MSHRKNGGMSAMNLVSLALVAAAVAAPAHAQGLSNATGVLEGFLGELKTITPILATIVLICAGVAYAAKWVELKTFAQIGIGCVVVGSAGPIVNTLMGAG